MCLVYDLFKTMKSSLASGLDYHHTTNHISEANTTKESLKAGWSEKNVPNAFLRINRGKEKAFGLKF